MAKLKGKAKAAFLRRMARGRNKHKRKHKRKHKHTKHTKHKRHSKRHTGGHHVARKRKHSKSRKGRRRHHAGGLGKYVPPTPDLISIGTAFAYGKVETAASKDNTHFLQKVPALVPQIGRAGNLGAIAWLGGVVTRHPIVKQVAKGILHVAAYQNGRGPAGGFTKDAQEFKLGRPGRGRDELMVENYLRRGGQ